MPPLSTKVPGPFFVKPRPETTPESVRVLKPTEIERFAPDIATPPARVALYEPVKPRSPVRAKALLIERAAAETSIVPPLTVKLPTPSAALLPSTKRPSTSVTPVSNVFAPESTNVPVPDFVNEKPVPATTPLIVSGVTPNTEAGAVAVKFWLMVKFVFGVIAVITAPVGMPAPYTGMPTNKLEVFVVVMMA